MGPARLAPGDGIDVRPHPHINLATVTYLFAGAIDHRDSLGTFATIEPGAVNLMTAGSGIAHSRALAGGIAPDGPELEGIQTWIALPTAKEEMDPALRACRQGGSSRGRRRRPTARVVMGSLWGATAPITCHSPTIYADITLAGRRPADRPGGRGARALCRRGRGEPRRAALDPGTLYVLRPGTRATLRSEDAAAMSCCAAAPR